MPQLIQLLESLSRLKMSSQRITDWNSGDKSGMVSVGTHRLFLSVSGPDRKPGDPVIILMQGLGSTIGEWEAVRWQVVPFARWLNYDRSGLGKSEAPPKQPKSTSAASVASELDILLKTAGIKPPFIMVCHSWGGITCREFLHLRPNDIVGVVFVDANTEKSFDGGNWPLPCVTAVTEGLSWSKETGLEASQVLGDKAWAKVKSWDEKPQHQKAEAAEQKGWQGDPPVLAAKRQIERKILGSHQVSVIKSNTARDMQRMYDAGVAAGNGTEAEREEYRNFLRDFDQKWTGCQKELLKISSDSRFIQIDEVGHNVQLEQPGLVAREIQWIWNGIQGKQQ